MKNPGRALVHTLVFVSVLLLVGCGGGNSSSNSGSQVTVTVSPTSASVAAGTQQQFTASVIGASNTAVNWFVNQQPNGNGTVGKITNTGLYTAPTTVPNPATVTVTAASQAATGQTASAQVTITASTVAITMTPPTSVTLPVGGTYTFNATVTGTSNTGIVWEVNSTAFGSSTVGTITNAGVYTAPANVPTPHSVTVTAVAQADSAKTASATVTVDLAVSPASIQMGVGSNMQFQETGSGGSAVNWEVNGTAGGSAALGTIDAAGLYIAPDNMPSSGSAVTITAVSQTDTTVSGTAAVTLNSTDPVGSVSNSKTISCPSTASGLPNGTCYLLMVSCSGVADYTTYVKVNQPSGTSLGTVLFTTGTGGSDLYDDAWVYGASVVQQVLNAGYTTAQISFGAPFDTSPSVANGWLTGPGGVRRLACRYATTAEWVHITIQRASTPLCATGNSGGSAAVAYAVAHYGLYAIFSMIEPTSGPPMSRLDYGCICNGGTSIGDPGPDPPMGCQKDVSYCYKGNAVTLIDAAYSAPICTQANGSGSTANESQFISDSINNSSATNTYSKTAVTFLFGGSDNTSALPQGLNWYESVRGSNKPGASCIANAPHELPSDQTAANQIATDITSMCTTQ